MSSHKFSGNYVALRPEEVTYVNLFRMFLKHDIEKRACVESLDGKYDSLHHGWIIFSSLLVQKFLQSMAKPMFLCGSWLRTWLNLVSCNRNIFVLLLNAIRGKVTLPVKESENFRSFMGHIDSRVELDKNIKPGDCRYYSALSGMAAKIAYENKAFVENVVANHWKMELLVYDNFWNDYQRKRSTQAFMFHDKTGDQDLIVVAFRGTEAFDPDDWCTDMDISWYKFPQMGKIHGGFMKALGLIINEGWPPEIEQETERPIAYYSIREELRKRLKENRRTKFILTGHSMGGALAILFPAVLALHGEAELLERLEGVYTFGQPRVGDAEFLRFMKNLLQTYGFKYLRFVYSNDVVTRLLTDDDSTFLFKHFGTCLYFNSCYKGKIVPEEPCNNYFTTFSAISMFFTAIWELIRSFVIPYIKGPEYREGWVLKLIRLYGLLFPGLSAHNPQDYNNITRLGQVSLYLRAQGP